MSKNYVSMMHNKSLKMAFDRKIKSQSSAIMSQGIRNMELTITDTIAYMQ